jgi:hypothetical protein
MTRTAPEIRLFDASLTYAHRRTKALSVPGCQPLPTASKTAKNRYSPKCQPITIREFPGKNRPANHMPTVRQLLPTALPTAVPTVFHPQLGKGPTPAPCWNPPPRGEVPQAVGTVGTSSEARKNPRRGGLNRRAKASSR